MGIANAVVGLSTQTPPRESLGPYQTKVSNQNGHLVIDARKGNDQIEVRQKGNTLQATVDGVHYKFDVRKLKSVTIAGGSGNDRIRVDRSVTFPLTLTGGSGNDFIDATNPGHNHVFGNSGRDHIHAKATDHVTTGNVLVHHRNFVRVLHGHGHGHGTVCVPMASPGQVPPPQPGVPPPATTLPSSEGTLPSGATNLTITDPRYGEYFGLPTGLNYALIPGEEIERLWNQVAQDSLNQSISQNARQCAANQKDKTKKLELLLQAALASGNIDLAILLVAGLETRQANDVAAGLLGRIRELQQQRGNIAKQMGDKETSKDPAKLSQLQTQAGDVGTEISLLQTFLQDVMAQKNEAQMLASNFLKSKHDTAQAIIRNIG